MMSSQTRFMVCGHWPGAQPQAFLKKMEMRGPNPNRKPQTTGCPFGLTLSYSEQPHKDRPRSQGLLPPPPTANSLQLLLKKEMSFLLFHVKRLVAKNPAGAC